MAQSQFDPNKHHRRSIRLQGYDYSQAGMYFITICTHNRECLFGKIVMGDTVVGAYSHTPLRQPQMQLNAYGKIVYDEWLKTPSLRPYVTLGEWVIMPNHIHAIVVLTSQSINEGRGVLYAPTTAPTNWRSPSHTVGAIVRGFKAAATKQINIQRGTPGLPVWQRNYWEHIIRDEPAYNHIAQYILNNPSTWQADKLYAML